MLIALKKNFLEMKEKGKQVGLLIDFLMTKLLWRHLFANKINKLRSQRTRHVYTIRSKIPTRPTVWHMFLHVTSWGCSIILIQIRLEIGRYAKAARKEKGSYIDGRWLEFHRYNEYNSNSFSYYYYYHYHHSKGDRHDQLLVLHLLNAYKWQ